MAGEQKRKRWPALATAVEPGDAVRRLGRQLAPDPLLMLGRRRASDNAPLRVAARLERHFFSRFRKSGGDFSRLIGIIQPHMAGACPPRRCRTRLLPCACLSPSSWLAAS